MKQLRVGYLSSDYPETRCIIGKTNAIYCKLNRYTMAWFVRQLRRALNLDGGRVDWNRMFWYSPVFKRPSVDLIHTFNAVCDVKRPWLVTFETEVPRTNYTVERPWEKSNNMTLDTFTEKEFKKLAEPNCIGLIALSHSSLRIQENMIRCVAPQMNDVLQAKTFIVPPPQETLVSENDVRRKFSQPIQCLQMVFVGGDFFRKGGAQLIDALSKLEEQYEFHLTVVSSVNYGDYVSGSTKQEQKKYIDLLRQKSWVTWHSHLKNKDVLEICRRSHIGFLPSFAETYGYSVLEMQACGVPTVTTDIRALPEINSEKTGWICHIAHDGIGGEAFYASKADFAQRTQELSAELDAVLPRILCASPETLCAKALCALRRVTEQNNPKKCADQLDVIYAKVNDVGTGQKGKR